MARITKEQLCKELTEKGIEFSPETNYNDLAQLLKPPNPEQENPQKLTTQTAYAQPPPTEQKEIKVHPVLPSQSCGRCKSYVFEKNYGVLVCRKRGGRRPETAGGDCSKFEVK